MRLIAIAALMAVLSACASNPQQQLALDVTARIAIRHALDTPRAVEKAQNIRAVAERVKAVTTADATVATLTAIAAEEIGKLNLRPIERADAEDLLMLFSALIEQRVGSGDLKPEGVVTVTEFADLIIRTLPVL